MRGYGDRVRPGQATLQLVREQQVGELGLGIDLPRVVGLLPMQVVEADSPALLMGKGADGDYAGSGDLEHRGEKKSGQSEVAKVIRAEDSLESIIGLALWR